MVLSEKPDKTLPKTLIWHSLIIHNVCWRRGALPQGLLSRALAPSMLTLPSNLAQSIFCSFPLSFKLFLSFPIFLGAFSFCFYAGKNLPLSRTILPFQARLRNWSCLVHRDGLFPASVLTHSHVLFLPVHISLSLPLLCCFLTAFAAVLTFPAAQELCLCPYYKPDQSRRTYIIREKRYRLRISQFFNFLDFVILEDLLGSWLIF